MRQFAEMHDIEITVIDNDTRLPAVTDADTASVMHFFRVSPNRFYWHTHR